MNQDEFRDDWRSRARCAGMDQDLFFPVELSVPVDERAAAACRDCTVRDRCLDWALRHERHGYWAGTSERQRRSLRRTLGIRLVDPDEATAPPPPEDLTA